MNERTVIDTPEGFDAAVTRIAAGTGPIAIDAERASGYRYSQRAYLIQVFRRGSGSFLFDPPAIGDMSALGAAGGDEEWVLHAASQDLDCLREVGIRPTRLFDTELSARLLGYPRVGLGAVVEQLLGIHLAKEHSAVDWSTRPLPDSWLEYAALDVELLVDLRDRLAGELREAGKDGIAAQEFDAELSKPAKPPRAEPWRRLSGVHAIRGQQNLAVARELWTVRDKHARGTDTAPGRLIPDSSIIAVVKEKPRTKAQLAAMRTFRGRASRTELDRWWAAIEQGRASTEPFAPRVPGETLPPPRAWAEKNPAADARLKAAKAHVTELSEARSIPVENLLTPDYLRRVAWAPPSPLTASSIDDALATLGARPWQRELLAAEVARLFVEADQSPGEAPSAGS
ncbi:ribonuclease D [Mycetocola reblochoni]|uniref:Ribonuclease D n=2 Tax=Mycetocola reblochoni TaxID=331618 RepID=A0A1R4K794_9MICO|nr:HRDC domain-containing protein [Mycetocola reblochoni]RLP67972.1 ribonuclease D [Mycetocola reblochoni]SJN39995.1 Ribonuclease D [Mycetocola reblochoni REB411]